MNHRNDRREIRRNEGVERQAERAKRTSQQQIALLDQRLGVGQGAVKERARLKGLGAK